jgi:hypothetical protein
VADHADRLGLLEEVTHELDGVGVGAQEVGVGDAAREHEPVVVGGVRVGDRPVDGERIGLVEVVEGLDVVIGDRDQLRRSARLLDRLPRLGELDLLDPLGRQERDLLAFQFISHGRRSTQPSAPFHAL